MGGGEDGKGRRSDIWQFVEYVILYPNINALKMPIIHRLDLRETSPPKAEKNTILL